MKRGFTIRKVPSHWAPCIRQVSALRTGSFAPAHVPYLDEVFVLEFRLDDESLVRECPKHRRLGRYRKALIRLCDSQTERVFCILGYVLSIALQHDSEVPAARGDRIPEVRVF